MAKVNSNNRKIKRSIAALGIAVIVVAAVFFSVNMIRGEREVSAKVGETSDVKKEAVIDNSKAHAKELFACKIDDADKSADVVKLLETVDVESVAGEYEAVVTEDGESRVLVLTFQEPVKEKNKKKFDNNMMNSSKQLLALIPEADQIKWVYEVSTPGAENESVAISLDAAGASKELSKDVKSYGESQETFRSLLTELAGKNKQ